MTQNYNYSYHYSIWHKKTPESLRKDILNAKYLLNIHNVWPRDKDSKILELGCGMGRLMLALREDGFLNLTGVDLDEFQISAAKEENLNVFQADAISFLKNNEEKYDVIYALDILEHLPKDMQVEALQEINKHLKTNGFLVLRIPNALSPIAARMRYSDFTHNILYTPITLSFLCKNAGLYNIVCRPECEESLKMRKLKSNHAEILKLEAGAEPLILTKNIVAIVFKEQTAMEQYLIDTPELINDYSFQSSDEILKTKKLSIKSILKNFFSIQNEYSALKKYKVIRFLGIKFSFSASENNKSKWPLNTTVIVRSVGERTEQKCIEYLENIFGRENVFLVKNKVPFSKAVEETFQIGLKQNKKWTLAIDADVFLFKDKITQFFDDAERFSLRESKLYCLEGKLFDKFSQTYREVGFHLYKTKALKKAMKFVEDGTNDIRPETYVKQKMAEIGYGFYVNDCQIGIHDFFQYPKNIVKKAILHCKKHGDVEKWIQKWKELSQYDSDFQWALKGKEIYDSLQEKTILVDKNYMDSLIAKYQISDSDLCFLNNNLIDESMLKYNVQKDYDSDFKIVFEKKINKLFGKTKIGDKRILYILGFKISYKKK